MLEITLITAVGQVLLPVVLLLWLWRGRSRRWVDRLPQCLATAAYLAMIAVTGVWLLLPWYVPYGYAMLGLGAALAPRRAAARGRSRTEKPLAAGMRRASLALAGFACVGVTALALDGRRPPVRPVVAMAAPLHGRGYFVVNGGFSILINPHLKALYRESLRNYRGQSYAVDIVKLDRMGLRAHGLWPADLHRYHIFGEAVYAPCDGEVIQAENGLPDLTPPKLDRGHPAGNFVYLGCSEAAILLAHLMQGSLVVAAGDRVHAGQYLGRVGNSGYTTEPHLHIHAQRLVSARNFMAGDPLPFRISDRAAVRNTRLTMAGGPPPRFTPAHPP